MYITVKPCRFCEKRFFVGEEIPEEYLLTEAIPRLIKSEMIAEVSGRSLLPPTSSIEKLQEGNVKQRLAYTKAELRRLKKDDLREIAVSLGIDRNSLTEDVTKAMLTEIILKVGT